MLEQDLVAGSYVAFDRLQERVGFVVAELQVMFAPDVGQPWVLEAFVNHMGRAGFLVGSAGSQGIFCHRT